MKFKGEHISKLAYSLLPYFAEDKKNKKSFLPPQAYQLQEARRFEFSSVRRHLAWENFPGEGATKDLEPLNVNETLWKENKSDRQLWRFFGAAEQKAGKKKKTTKPHRLTIAKFFPEYRGRIYILLSQEAKWDSGVTESHNQCWHGKWREYHCVCKSLNKKILNDSGTQRISVISRAAEKNWREWAPTALLWLCML